MTFIVILHGLNSLSWCSSCTIGVVGAEACGMRSAESRKVYVLEMKWLGSLVGVSQTERVRIRRGAKKSWRLWMNYTINRTLHLQSIHCPLRQIWLRQLKLFIILSIFRIYSSNNRYNLNIKKFYYRTYYYLLNYSKYYFMYFSCWYVIFYEHLGQCYEKKLNCLFTHNFIL